MASLTIRNLDPTLKEKLRIRAAEHGRSMESEARLILQSTLHRARLPESNLYDRIRGRFDLLDDGPEIPVPPHEPMRDPPTFD